MKFGICGYLTATNGDGIEFNLPEMAKKIGFDYIELPLSTTASLNQDEFNILQETLARSGLPCEACNLMFPRTVRVTGPEASDEQISTYLELAFARAAGLGVKVIVFGSAGARNAPEGFPLEKAWQQLIAMLRLADPLAGRHGLTIAIEPLNSQESNLINSGAEGYTLAKLVNRENIRLLLDYYHMARDEEDPGIAVTARNYVRHVHFANPRGRVFPDKVEADYQRFFSALKQAGYNERVSLEAAFNDFASDAPPALAVLRELVEK